MARRRAVTTNNINQQELLVLQKKLQEQELVLKDNQAKIELLNTQIMSKEEGFSNLEIALSESKEKNESLIEENTSLKNSLRKTIGEKDEYLEKLNKKEKDIEKLKSQTLELKEKVKLFEKNIKSLYEILYSQNEKLFSAIKQSEKVQVDLVRLDNKNKILIDNFESLKSQLSYKVGNILVNTIKRKEMIKDLPSNLLGAYKDFYKEKVRKEIEKNVIYLPEANKITKSILFHEEGHVISLRYNTYPLFLNKDQLSRLKGLNLKPFSVKPGSSTIIRCNLKLLEGSIVLKTKFKEDLIVLNNNNRELDIKFEITDGENTNLFSFQKVDDAVLEFNFSKVSGQPVTLILNKNNIEELSNNSIKLQESLTVENIKNDMEVKYNLPDKPRVHLMWNAMNIAKEFGYPQALHYAENFKKELNKNAINILKANAYHNDEDKWLKSVNEYIKSFNMEPIILENDKSKDRYDRISSNVRYKIDGKEKITVIMPAYNAEKTILKAVTSILNQTWTNIELIVVDDCSTDNTYKILKGIKDERLKVIKNKENVGAYVSKNIALKKATGDFVTGHDSDDWAHPQRIEKHIAEIKKFQQPIRASVTYMMRVDKHGFFSHIGKEGTFSTDGVLRIASITCMFETKFLKDVLGGWDSVRFGADSEIIARAKLFLGDEFKHLSCLSMICLDAEGSLTNDPVHGVSKVTGISPTRKVYRDSWMEWHKGLTDNVYLEFPHSERKFSAPEAVLVDIKSINTNLKQM